MTAGWGGTSVEFACIRADTVVLVSTEDRGQRTVFEAPRGASVSAVGWRSDGRRLYIGVGLDLWEWNSETGASALVTRVPGAPTDVIAVVTTQVGTPTVLIETASRAQDPNEVDPRRFALTVDGGALEEIDGRAFAVRAGRAPAYAGPMRPPVLSASGNWSVEVQSVAVALKSGGGAAERVLVRRVGARDGSDDVRAISVRDLDGGANLSGIFLDVRWAPSDDMLMLVAERDCSAGCTGPLTVLRPTDGSLVRLGERLGSAPRTWNGDAVVFEDTGPSVVCAWPRSGDWFRVENATAPCWRPGEDAR